MRTVVVSFGTPDFDGDLAVLRHSALHAAGADEVRVYGPADVQPFFDANPGLGDPAATRGYGWWAWKPHVILRTLEALDPGDLVVYVDAAAYFVAPLAPLAAAAVRDVMLFRLGEAAAKGYTNERWTHPAALERMGRADERHRQAYQVNAAVQAYRNTHAARAFLREYLRWCCDPAVVADAPGFQHHRHDQSVLSLLAVDAACVDVLKDPTQHGVADPAEAADFGQLLHHHRQRLGPLRVAVITPTTGSRHLRACVDSVQAQTLPNVEHWVVTDGPEFEPAVDAVLRAYRHRGVVHRLTLPKNTGRGGWNGHRVYGALPCLVDADYVAYLDEDNEFEPDHLARLLRRVVDAGAAWGFSLRALIDQDGQPVVDEAGRPLVDQCESLGGLAHAFGARDDRLVDTSCYLLKRSLAVDAAPCWNLQARWPDRRLARTLLASDAPWAALKAPTVRYRLDATAASVSADFFRDGNRRTRHAFSEAARDVYVFHFNPEATRAALAKRGTGSDPHAEWQPTMYDAVDAGAVHLVDGYANADCIPRGAAVFVALCHPEAVPWDLLRSRPDLRRVAYTLESPNIRHQAQWDPATLDAAFDVIMTYWEPLLRALPAKAAFAPHNTHFRLAQPLPPPPADPSKSVCVVLERRNLAGEYEIGGVRLRCLDSLRGEYAAALADAGMPVTAHGPGWAGFHPGITVGHAASRASDPRRAVDHYAGHGFVLVVENCDAEGYVSEKLYDALWAGCVPLYHGRPGPRLGLPADAYVDIADKTPEELGAWLAAMSDADFRGLHARVMRARGAAMALVTAEAWAERFHAAVIASAAAS